MNNNKNKIYELKKNYDSIEIPDELSFVVNNAINKNKRRKRNIRHLITAASVVVVVGVININPTFANTLEEIPVIGSVVKVVNFANYKIKEGTYEASIKVPKIEGLDNKDLEYKLNAKFKEDGEKLYKQYLEEVKELKDSASSEHKSSESWYEVKSDNDKILSIVIYNYQAQGSSNISRKFYNIDKKNQTVLTLEGMFKNDDYIKKISDNIKEQMQEQMKKDENKYYWLNDEIIGDENFKAIKKDQGFYINNNGELVICFDKYEVAPGYMGLIEFTIPKDVIKELLN